MYCLESTDQEDGVELEGVAAAPVDAFTERSPDRSLGGAVAVEARGALRTDASAVGWPYSGTAPRPAGSDGRLTFIPYHAWGNRGLSTMRVWVPEA